VLISSSADMQGGATAIFIDSERLARPRTPQRGPAGEG
jgi:hypothetical protein